jgi:hypothetical protein
MPASRSGPSFSFYENSAFPRITLMLTVITETMPLRKETKRFVAFLTEETPDRSS